MRIKIEFEDTAFRIWLYRLNRIIDDGLRYNSDAIREDDTFKVYSTININKSIINDVVKLKKIIKFLKFFIFNL